MKLLVINTGKWGVGFINRPQTIGRVPPVQITYPTNRIARRNIHRVPCKG